MYKEKNVLITGGGSGIGRIMARKYLELVAQVVIWDVSDENIALTLVELETLGRISAYRVDISNSTEVTEVALRVLNEVGRIDILINNAGIVVGKMFADTTVTDIDRTMHINTHGAMYTTLAFLPAMLQAKQGNICNIASSAAFVSNPKMTVYAASKWAMAGWSDSLRTELKSQGIKVTTVMPYYINTGMFAGVKSRIPILEPEHVASTIVRSVERGRKLHSTPGWLYPVVRIAQGVMSVALLDLIMGRLFGVYKTMDNFVGRK